MNKKIEVEALIKRIIIDETTITALLCLLNQKGVSEEEAGEFVHNLLMTITTEEWEELSRLALDTCCESSGGDA